MAHCAQCKAYYVLSHSHSASCWYKVFKVFIRFLQGFFGRIFHAIVFLSPVLGEKRKKKHSLECVQRLPHHTREGGFTPLKLDWEGLQTNQQSQIWFTVWRPDQSHPTSAPYFRVMITLPHSSALKSIQLQLTRDGLMALSTCYCTSNHHSCHVLSSNY